MLPYNIESVPDNPGQWFARFLLLYVLASSGPQPTHWWAGPWILCLVCILKYCKLSMLWNERTKRTLFLTPWLVVSLGYPQPWNWQYRINVHDLPLGWISTTHNAAQRNDAKHEYIHLWFFFKTIQNKGVFNHSAVEGLIHSVILPACRI